MSIFRMDDLPHQAGQTETEVILQYLASLRTELRYVLTHLDADNFSERGLDELARAMKEREEAEDS